VGQQQNSGVTGEEWDSSRILGSRERSGTAAEFWGHGRGVGQQQNSGVTGEEWDSSRITCGRCIETEQSLYQLFLVMKERPVFSDPLSDVRQLPQILWSLTCLIVIFF
jgi:hypothetical protein